MAAQDYEQVTYSGPDGAQVGAASTDKIGFWGVTPVTLGSTIAAATNSGTTVSNVLAQLNSLITELQRKGVIA